MSRSVKWVSVLCMFAVAACAIESDHDARDVGPPAPEEPREGDRGVMRVNIRGRATAVPYIVRNGRAMWEEDIDLGPAPSALRAYAIRELGARWPDGNINFLIMPGTTFSHDDLDTIQAAMDDYEHLTPIRFHKKTAVVAGPMLLIMQYSADDGLHAKTSTVGLDEPDGVVVISVNTHPGEPLGKGTMLHELGHALGFTHEQRRPGADNVIDFDPFCTVDPSQFGPASDADNFETFEGYDLDSIMQYLSWGVCTQAGPGDTALAHNNCLCYPLTRKKRKSGGDCFIDAHFMDDNDCLIDRAAKLSPKDIRALWRMYPPRLAKVEPDDQFGASMAAGDFDNDGFTDLAVGAPGDGRDVTSSGSILFYKGTSAGLVPWRILSEEDVVSDPHVGDRFGEVLAAGDFDGDGFDDLVVGTPHRKLWGAGDGGAVFVLMGSDAGVTNTGHELNQTGYHTGTTENGDLFGAAVAVGDLDGDDHPDVVIGVPGEVRNGVRSGFVHIFTWDDASKMFAPGQSFGEPGTPADGDGFGSALVINNFDNHGRRDLAVGAPAPSSSTNPGAVFLYFNTGSSMVLQQTLHEAASGADAPAGGDRFGAQLAAGQFDRTNDPSTTTPERQLVVGAPFKDNPLGSGRVFVFRPRYDPANHVTGLRQASMLSQTAVPGSSANEEHDHFGSVLRVVDLDGDDLDDLLVGVPQENLNGTDAGVVLLFHGSASGLKGWGRMVDLWPAENAHFGASVIARDFNKDGVKDVMVGVPDVNASAGALRFFFGNADTPSAPIPLFVNWDEAYRLPE